MNWKGGKIEDFVTSLNKRGKDVIKASLIGINKGNKALLLESLKTGDENTLIFKNVDCSDFINDYGNTTIVALIGVLLIIGSVIYMVMRIR